jgi:squalene-hopene/tetraprenyl-beta-curcumene cyclase
MPRLQRFGQSAVCLSICLMSAAWAADAASQPADPGDRAEAMIQKGLGFLKANQEPDFSWQNSADPPGMSALVLKAFMQNPKYDADDAFLDKAFDKLLTYQKPDGSISNDVLTTYNTAIAISALAISKEAEYKEPIQKALAYLRNLQWSDKIEGVPNASKKVGPDDPNYGGFGYGRQGRADLSNTSFALDALKDAGLKSDDPAFQAALKFVTRCQNNSETNDQKWAGDDGGFVYFPAGGGASPAGNYIGPNGEHLLRSYGTMTYAGLKSMIYAGLSKDDPRVKAAWHWIASHWTVDENPGMNVVDPNDSNAGLYYYFHTMARALHAYGEPVVTDSSGKKHDWRLELIDKIQALQHPDGSCVGISKWMENKPILATTFAVLALQEAQADLKEHPAVGE